VGSEIAGDREESVSAPVSGRGRAIVSRLVAGLVVAILVASALALFADARDLTLALRRFDWRLAVPALALTLWNYGLRFLKWQLYLRRLGVVGLPPATSGLVFLSAFSMSVTPGKVGELIKATHLRRLTGTPLTTSTAIIAAERLTDGIAMIVLAAIGAVQFAYARAFLAAAAVLALLAAVALRSPARLRSVLERVPPLPLVGRPADHADAFFAASGSLLAPRPMLWASALGVVAWFGECVALYLILVGLGLPASWHLLLVAVFTLAVSSLAGAVSMLPGGLGVAEASVAAMLLLLVEDDRMTRPVAAAATLLIRFGTLWFAVLLGVLALVALRRVRPIMVGLAPPAAIEPTAEAPGDNIGRGKGRRR
jgi:uncharacterized membrane protein YbhN (UPF0104 family)